jgi:hypothetical protein
MRSHLEISDEELRNESQRGRSVVSRPPVTKIGRPLTSAGAAPDEKRPPDRCPMISSRFS